MELYEAEAGIKTKYIFLIINHSVLLQSFYFFHQEGHEIQSEASSQLEQHEQVQGDLIMEGLFGILQAAGFDRSGDFRKWKGGILPKK